eukprot:CAMPEP_0169210406 /NCGR_PEP_ID=MMETSP1016-20121227/15200_1 /TAXON_ID=342587 /ORGANISM="Karlodinium micrum, Strain CCMP2283" /LENGTH=125 /DNA_ID=CAMNT_0009287949 /DNA_START=11 /DNA_END=388 /DNA_ORIENTATION=-
MDGHSFAATSLISQFSEQFDSPRCEEIPEAEKAFGENAEQLWPLRRKVEPTRCQQLHEEVQHLEQELGAKDDKLSQLFRSNLALSMHVDQQEEWILDLSERLQKCESQLQRKCCQDGWGMGCNLM